MNEFDKPDMTKAALIGSLVAGIPAGVPGLDLLNCVCCLWVVSGGILAASLLQKSTEQPIQYGQGALVGLLTGLGAAVVATLVKVPFLMMGVNMGQRFIQWILDNHGDKMDPAQIEQLEEALQATEFTGMALAVGALQSLVAFAIFGTIAGVIGVAIFAKKQTPPPASGTVIDATPEPPPAPPVE